MAIASVGTLGTAAHSTSASSFQLTTATNSLAAGDWALLFVSVDNRTGSDGSNFEHTGVTGGTGKWEKVDEWTNSVGGAAGDGVTISAWKFEASGTLAIGSTITISLSGAATDKAASMWKFTKAAGTRIVFDLEATINAIRNTQDASNGFGSAAFSGLSSAPRIYVRALGKEANTTTQITPSGGFTAVTNTRSRNNASAVSVFGEFKIATSTGETSNPTLAVSGDTAGIFFALKEVTPLTTAPANDNFDDNSVDTSFWNSGQPLGLSQARNGTIAEQNLRTEITPPTSATGCIGRTTVNAYDFTSGSGLRAYIKLTPSGTLKQGQQQGIVIGSGPGNYYLFYVTNNGGTITLNADRSINGSAGGLGTPLTYNSTTHAWLSVRHGGSGDDNFYLEYASSSGSDPPSSWTTFASGAPQIDLTAVFVGFTAGIYLSDASPTRVDFDGFNGPTTSTIALVPAASAAATTSETPSIATNNVLAPNSSAIATTSEEPTPVAGNMLIVADESIALTTSAVPALASNYVLAPNASVIALAAAAVTIQPKTTLAPAGSDILTTAAANSITPRYVLAPASSIIALVSEAPAPAGHSVMAPAASAIALVSDSPVLAPKTTLAPAASSIATTSAGVAVGSNYIISPAASSLALTSANVTLATNTVLTPASSVIATTSANASVAIGGTPLFPAASDVLLTSANVTITTNAVLAPAASVIATTSQTPALASNYVLAPASSSLQLTAQAVTIAPKTTLAPASSAAATTADAVSIAAKWLLAPASSVIALTAAAPSIATKAVLAPAASSLVTRSEDVILSVGGSLSVAASLLATTSAVPMLNVGMIPASSAIATTSDSPSLTPHWILSPAAASLALTAQNVVVAPKTALQPASSQVATTIQSPVILTNTALQPQSSEIALLSGVPTISFGAVLDPAGSDVALRSEVVDFANDNVDLGIYFRVIS